MWLIYLPDQTQAAIANAKEMKMEDLLLLADHLINAITTHTATKTSVEQQSREAPTRAAALHLPPLTPPTIPWTEPATDTFISRRSVVTCATTATISVHLHANAPHPVHEQKTSNKATASSPPTDTGLSFFFPLTGTGFYIINDNTKTCFLVNINACWSIYPANPSEKRQLNYIRVSLIATNGNSITTYDTNTLFLASSGHCFTWAFVLTDMKMPLLGNDLLALAWYSL